MVIVIIALQQMHLVGASFYHFSIDWCIELTTAYIATQTLQQERSDAIHRVFFALRHSESRP
jgi:hypothetical protein